MFNSVLIYSYVVQEKFSHSFVDEICFWNLRNWKIEFQMTKSLHGLVQHEQIEQIQR